MKTKDRIKKQNEHGFSMIEIIITFSIVGMMGVTLATSLTPMIKSQNTNQFNQELRNFQQELKNSVSSEEYCAAAFNLAANSLSLRNNSEVDVTLVSLLRGANIHNASIVNSPSSDIEVTRIFLDNITFRSQSAGVRHYEADLMLRAKPNDDSTFSSAGLKDRVVTRLHMLARTAGVNNVFKCAGGEALSPTQNDCTSPNAIHGGFNTYTNGATRCQITNMCSNGVWTQVATKCPQPTPPDPISSFHNIIFKRTCLYTKVTCSGRNCRERLHSDQCR